MPKTPIEEAYASAYKDIKTHLEAQRTAVNVEMIARLRITMESRELIAKLDLNSKEFLEFISDLPASPH